MLPTTRAKTLEYGGVGADVDGAPFLLPSVWGQGKSREKVGRGGEGVLGFGVQGLEFRV